MLELLLESFSALLLAATIFVLALNLRRTALTKQFGIRLILIGFCLLFFGAALDISDEYPRLNFLLILGDTPLQSFCEKFFGRFLGGLFLFLGVLRIMPVFAELTGKHKLIETTLETIPAPTYCKNIEGVYLACNQAFEDFLGLPREQILGKTVFDVAPPELAEIYQRADRALLREGGRAAYETQVRGADGVLRDVLFHKAVYHYENGVPAGVVGVLLDISLRKKAEEGLRKLDRMKSEFISSAAHELRTPLTMVKGYTELLLEQYAGTKNFTSTQQVDFLHEIYDGSEALTTLIDDLLDVGRIEIGGSMPMNIRSDNPEHLLRKIVDTSLLRHPQQEILLHYSAGPELRVLFDRQRFRQVLENLLSNAVKYSPENERIEVSARRVGDFFQVQVRDRGIGMSPEDQARIFDKFYRAENSKELVEGLGIGLSITRSIIEAHGGQIRVESALGKGTLVEVKLPLAS